MAVLHYYTTTSTWQAPYFLYPKMWTGEEWVYVKPSFWDGAQWVTMVGSTPSPGVGGSPTVSTATIVYPGGQGAGPLPPPWWNLDYN